LTEADIAGRLAYWLPEGTAFDVVAGFRRRSIADPAPPATCRSWGQQGSRPRGMKVLLYVDMTKAKITLTLDAEQLDDLRVLVGGRSLSATVDNAVAAYLAKLRHLHAVDEWLAELEQEHGPVPPETLEWAAQVVDKWDASARPPSRKAG
jgi:hypothetical protein